MVTRVHAAATKKYKNNATQHQTIVNSIQTWQWYKKTSLSYTDSIYSQGSICTLSVQMHCTLFHESYLRRGSMHCVRSYPDSIHSTRPNPEYGSRQRATSREGYSSDICLCDLHMFITDECETWNILNEASLAKSRCNRQLHHQFNIITLLSSTFTE